MSIKRYLHHTSFILQLPKSPSEKGYWIMLKIFAPVVKRLRNNLSAKASSLLPVIGGGGSPNYTIYLFQQF